MRRTNTQQLNQILSDFLKENPALADKLAETRLLGAWEKLMGRLTARYTTGLFIKNKTLYVKLSSSVLRNELQMCREQLIRNLNKEAGSDVIENIVLS